MEGRDKINSAWDKKLNSPWGKKVSSSWDKKVISSLARKLNSSWNKSPKGKGSVHTKATDLRPFVKASLESLFNITNTNHHFNHFFDRGKVPVK